MIIAGVDKKLVNKVVAAANGLPVTSGTIYTSVWRESDNYFWDGSSWVSSGVSAGDADHVGLGSWEFVLSGTATSSLADDIVFFDMTDSLTASGVTTTAAGGEHYVHLTTPGDVTSVSGNAVTGVDEFKADTSSVALEASVQTNQTFLTTISGDLQNKPDTADFITVSGLVEQTDSELTSTHGAGSWTTASGFATNNDLGVVSGNISQISVDLGVVSGNVDTANNNISQVSTDLGVVSGTVDTLPTAAEIDTELSTVHGSGLWTGEMYEDGAVWIDDVNGTSGTTYPIGSSRNNAVDNFADAVTIANSNNSAYFRILAATVMPLANLPAGRISVIEADHNLEAILDLNNVTLGNGVVLRNVYITGQQFSDFKTIVLENCRLLNATNLTAWGNGIELVNGMSFRSGVGSGNKTFKNVAFSVGATVDLTGHTSTVDFIRCAGDVTVSGSDNSGATAILDYTGGGLVTLGSSCVDGTIKVRGNCDLVDNTASGCTVLDERTTILTDTVLTSAHGAGAWTTAESVDLDVSGIASGVEELLSSTHGSGLWEGTTPSDINALLISEHGSGLWEGTTPSDIDTLLSANHGAGNWDAISSLTLSGIASEVGTELEDEFHTIINFIEYQRKAHTGHNGNYLYVDPYNGLPLASGADGSSANPFDNLTDAISVTVDSAHTTIFLVAGDPAGVTVLTENVTVDKRYVFIRGPGRDFQISGVGTADTFTVTADGVSLEGFQVFTGNAGTPAGIYADGTDFLKAEGVWVNSSRGHGIHVRNSDNAQVLNCTLQSAGTSGAGHGIVIDGTGGDYTRIMGNYVSDTQGDGIRSGGLAANVLVADNIIHGSTSWGINVVGGSHVILTRNILGENSSGDIKDTGTNTMKVNNEQWSVPSDLHVYEVVPS